MKKFITKPFRKDLDLRSRWWHRLLLVFTMLFFTGFFVINLRYDSNLFILPIPQWEQVGVLEDRISKDLKSIEEMMEYGEMFESTRSSSRHLNFLRWEIENLSYDDNIYCASNIQDHLERLMEITGTRKFYSGGGYNSKNITEFPIMNISKYLQESSTRCLVKDAYYPSGNSDNSKISFLRTANSLYKDNELFNEKAFFKESKNNTLAAYILDVIVVLLMTLALFYFVAIIYHKIILYIIFGNKNTK